MTPKNVSKFIKNLRNKNNLTQKKLAKELGVTYQAVSKWENGKNIPDIEILKLICDKYNVNIEDIIGTKKKKNSNKNNSYYHIYINNKYINNGYNKTKFFFVLL